MADLFSIDFRVCLSAQRLEETEYTITDITSVTCEIGTVTRNLIDNGVADGVTRKSGATFRSVVTPDYFSGDSRTLACSGTVALEKVTTTAPTPAPLPDWFLTHDRDSGSLNHCKCLIVYGVEFVPLSLIDVISNQYFYSRYFLGNKKREQTIVRYNPK